MKTAIPSKERARHFRFAVWAFREPTPPSVGRVMRITGLSYESARRWRKDWLDTLAASVRNELLP